MDYMVPVEINDETYYLSYSVEVMFATIEKYGSVREILKQMADGGREALRVVKEMMVLLAEDGELARREKGYDHKAFLTLGDFPARPMPFEVIHWREAVTNAIAKGYNRETQEAAEEVD